MSDIALVLFSKVVWSVGRTDRTLLDVAQNEGLKLESYAFVSGT